MVNWTFEHYILKIKYTVGSSVSVIRRTQYMLLVSHMLF